MQRTVVPMVLVIGQGTGPHPIPPPALCLPGLVFHCLPIVADVLQNKLCGPSIVIVILPLCSLMEDQVTHLGTLGVPIIVIKDDKIPELILEVIAGV